MNVKESIKLEKDRVAAREARFLGGENVIRMTSEKVPTTEAVQKLGKGKPTVEATRLSVVIPGWARPQIEALLESERDPDRRATFASILAGLGPGSGEFLIGEESPIETTYEGIDYEDVA